MQPCPKHCRVVTFAAAAGVLLEPGADIACLSKGAYMGSTLKKGLGILN